MHAENKQLTDQKTESWQMFDAISRHYDFLNQLLSWGLDKSWRKELLKHLPNQPGQVVLDIATGTADVLITLLENNPNIRLGYGIDMSAKMLNLGHLKIEKRGLASRAMLQKGDAQDLHFLDGTFSTVTIAFGIRNIPLLMKGLMEMYRVLKPEGRALILEFSLPKNALLRLGHLFYLRGVIPIAGFLVSGNYQAYKYLNQTIEDFPYGDRFCKIIAQVGFKNVKAFPLLGGVATIYQADK